MPRCCICDYSSEVDGNDGREFYWSKKEGGHVCENCNQVTWENLNEISASDELEDGEYSNLVGLGILEIDDLEKDLREYRKRDRHSAGQDEDILSDGDDASS